MAVQWTWSWGPRAQREACRGAACPGRQAQSKQAWGGAATAAASKQLTRRRGSYGRRRGREQSFWDSQQTCAASLANQTLLILKSCCRAVPDDRFEVLNNIVPAWTLVSQKVPLSSKTDYEEKGQQILNAVTWQSISRDAGPAAAQSNHQCPWEDQFHAIEQEKMGIARQKARIHIWIRSADLHFV